MDREQELILVRLAQRQRDQIRRQKENAAKAKERKEARRHTFPLARVVHPAHGELIVRAESKCDAVNVAARRWGVPFVSISRETEVWHIPTGERDLNSISGRLCGGQLPQRGELSVEAAGAASVQRGEPKERREDHGTVESK